MPDKPWPQIGVHIITNILVTQNNLYETPFLFFRFDVRFCSADHLRLVAR